MTVSKRKFLGIAAGGAVATPAFAKTMVNAAGCSNLVGPGTMLMTDAKCDPTPFGDKLSQPISPLERVKYLLERRDRVASGQGMDVLTSDHLPSHYDSLRSVAANPRRVMLNDAVVRRERDNQLSWIDEEIAELKKQMGPLAWVLK